MAADFLRAGAFFAAAFRGAFVAGAFLADLVGGGSAAYRRAGGGGATIEGAITAAGDVAGRVIQGMRDPEQPAGRLGDAARGH